jgi:transmembrane sensor
MNIDSNHPRPADAGESAASQWLARRDRGLTAAEQDAYLQWLRENPRHGREIARLEKVWGVLDQLTEWRPKHSPQPNPDLLAPRRRGRIYWLSTAALAAVAAVALLLFVGPPQAATPAPRQAIVHPGPERLVLEDGSMIELNTGAKVDVRFTPAERRVQLLSGEAHFTVAKDPNRPFTVGVDKIAVRAVGTAFNVALGRQDVSVLVTKGKVQVSEQGTGVDLRQGHGPQGAEQADGSQPSALNAQPFPTFLTAGQRTVVDLTAEVAPIVQEVTPAEMERALSWQGIRLEFVDMPLGDVVTEFNRYNRQKLIVHDTETAALLVGGNFRADNVETFVRLLDLGFGVSAFRINDEVVLRKRP